MYVILYFKYFISSVCIYVRVERLGFPVVFVVFILCEALSVEKGHINELDLMWYTISG